MLKKRRQLFRLHEGLVPVFNQNNKILDEQIRGFQQLNEPDGGGFVPFECYLQGAASFPPAPPVVREVPMPPELISQLQGHRPACGSS